MKKLLIMACMAGLAFTACEKDNQNDTNKVQKEDIANYEVIKLKGYKFVEPLSEQEMTINFDILDRNLGATKAYDSKASADDQKQAIGYYYQYGNSTPVANVDGVNAEFVNTYKGDKLDWSKPENTPCPEGWRLPTKEECSLLANAFEVYDPFYGDQTDAGYEFGKNLKVAASGQWMVKGDDEAAVAAGTPVLYLPDACYFWGSDKATGDKAVSKRGFPQAGSFENNLFPIGTYSAEVNSARPIRCVK